MSRAIALLLSILFFCFVIQATSRRIPFKRKLRPTFNNIAFGRKFKASSTCGSNGTTTYCKEVRTYREDGSSGMGFECENCTSSMPHSTELMTDPVYSEAKTFWISETFYETKQPVFLELDLKKKYIFLFFTINFPFFRPKLLTISKKTGYGDAEKWQSWFSFSDDCNKIEEKCISTKWEGHKDVALSATSYQIKAKSEKERVFTAIRIDLKKLYTFGDEPFATKPEDLQKYFYAISNIDISAYCMCNGHASECASSGDGVDSCICKHHTTGKDCEKCLQSHNSRPYGKGCRACKCNGLADKCEFDKKLWKKSRRRNGGRCVDCRKYADGPWCEKCKMGFYKNKSENKCLPCDCNTNGAISDKCSDDGICKCKKGVKGKKCNKCKKGFTNLSSNGCEKMTLDETKAKNI